MPTNSETMRSVVEKHVNKLPLFLESRPVAGHTQQAFDEFLHQAYQPRTDLVLDSCCGTGRSTLHLAKTLTATDDTRQLAVVGVDKSIARLGRNAKYHLNVVGETRGTSSGPLTQKVAAKGRNGAAHNAWLARANVIDFWRLLHQHEIPVKHHYVLYPNPYPKKEQWQNRWYGHAIFPLLFLLQSETITVRSNWLQYLTEWKQTVGIIAAMDDHSAAAANIQGIVHAAQAYDVAEPRRRTPTKPAWTNFEDKFVKAGETIYELTLVKK